MTTQILNNEQLKDLSERIQWAIECFEAQNEKTGAHCVRQPNGTYIVTPKLHLSIKGTIFFAPSMRVKGNVLRQSRFGRSGGFETKGYKTEQITAAIELFNQIYLLEEAGQELFNNVEMSKSPWQQFKY